MSLHPDVQAPPLSMLRESVADRSVLRSAALARAELLLALAGGVLLSVAHGIHHVYSNQTQYFLFGYRLADPAFLPRDWFTWSTTHHHFAFGYLQWALMQLPSFFLSAVAAQVASTVALALGLFLLTRRFCRHAWPVYWLTLLWLALGGPAQAGLGGFDLLSPFLQPSGVAGGLIVLGLALLFERRFLAAGVCLGAGGVFHVPILLAMAPAVLVLVLACKLWRRPIGLLSFSVPIVAFWGLAFMFLVRHGMPRDPSTLEGLRVLFFIRSPHHHLVSQWDPAQTLSWLLWVVAGGWAILRGADGPRERELRVVWAVSLLVVTAGTLLALWPESPWAVWAKLNVMTPFRVAPWPLLLALIVFLDRWAGAFLDGEATAPQATRFALLLMLVAGAAWIATTPQPATRWLRAGWILALPAAALVSAGTRRFGGAPAAAATLARGLPVILGLVAAHGLVTQSSAWRGDPSAEALEALRRNTPEDAIVIVPVGMEKTRLLARRAIVVDEKCFSAIPSEALEWYRRMCDVCGLEPTPRRTKPDWRAGYRTLDTARALRLSELYGATHVVVESRVHRGDTAGLLEIYRGDRYRIFQIPPHPGAIRPAGRRS